MTPTHADEVQHLWADRFGGRSSTQQSWIDAALASQHSAMGFVAAHRDENDVVGFALLEVGGRSYTRQYLGLDTLALTLPLEDRNGIFHMCCVRADWEGMGIGSAFYARRLHALSERNVSRTVGIAWHRPHSVDSRRLFEKWGFRSVATIERYYARTESRPNCPDCGGPCTCTATLYARTGGNPQTE